jgi:3-oxoadipate enol-lactonase
MSARRPAVHWHEGGAGAAVLLLNGWTASGLVWPAGWLREFERERRVIRVDNRGCGWSRTAPMPCTIADMADDAADVLRTNRITRASVLGLSMGGMIAQELALRHPDLVERLVLVGTRPPSPAHLPLPRSEVRAAVRPRGRGEAWSDFVGSLWARQAAPGFAARRPEVIDEIVTSVLRRSTPQRGVLGQARAVMAWHSPGRLARLTAPTVVVHGAADPMMPVGNGMRLSRLVPGARYVEVPDVGHLVPYEAPEALTDAVLRPLEPVTGAA